VPAYAYTILALAWLAWILSFQMRKRTSRKPQQVNTRARWGIVLEMIAFFLIWRGRFWERTPEIWRFVLAILFFVTALSLAWKAVAALGRHWRIEAALDADHELVRSGPYAIVRHPIYTSMLCMLLGTGLMITPWPLFLAALLIFVAGTEIRVRSEDGLLSARFGEEFARYRRSVPAYIPGLRW